jgi:uncharacterized protein
MSSCGRWVVDTNLLISRLLLPKSVPAKAVQAAMEAGDLLVSEATLEELADVVSRTKFDKYLTVAERQEFFELLARVAVRVEILRPVKACRDPNDDKFLEVAVNGSALAIVTGDDDLLSLHPFMGISILTPGTFLKILPQP